MVARLLRLRLALLGASLRGGARVVSRSLLLGVIGIAVAACLALAPEWFARSDPGRAALDILVSSILLAAIALVPFFGALTLLEPRQFSGLPVGSIRLATGLFVSSVLSWPMLWLFVLLSLRALLQPRWAEVPWSAVTAVGLTMLLAITFVRVSSALIGLISSSRAIAAIRMTGLLLLLAALPIAVFVLTEGFRSPLGAANAETVHILGLTPFGAPVAGLEYAIAGDTEAALLRFGIAAATLVVLVVVWYLLVARSLTTVMRPVPAGVVRDGFDSFDRFPARPRGVIASRVLSYWRRDPRYRVALVAIPVAPVVMLVALWIAGVEPQLLALLPLPIILLLLGWSIHNDVALDSTAIWMHVASGTRGRDDRIGRLAPVMLLGLPLVMFGSSISVTVAADWRVLPAVIGMNIAVLLVSAGVSSVFSVLIPYPATRPGDSPFAQPAVAGSRAGLAQTLSMLAALLLSLPPVLLSVQAIIEPRLPENLLALFFGLLWGVLMLGLGVALGGKIFERRGPEIVALTQTFD